MNRIRTNWMAGNVTLCKPCIDHFGEGYPLQGAKLGAVVRYHRVNSHLDRRDREGNAVSLFPIVFAGGRRHA